MECGPGRRRRIPKMLYWDAAQREGRGSQRLSRVWQEQQEE